MIVEPGMRLYMKGVLVHNDDSPWLSSRFGQVTRLLIAKRRRSQALQTLLIAHQALVCVLIILRLLIRLKDSFMAPKDVLQKFADLAEEENVGDPFAETKSQRQIASRQSE